jgi:hypothetical protein
MQKNFGHVTVIEVFWGLTLKLTLHQHFMKVLMALGHMVNWMALVNGVMNFHEDL